MANETVAPTPHGLRANGEPALLAKLLRSPFFWLIIAAISVAIPLALRSYRSINPTVGAPLSQLTPFELKDQEGAAFTLDSFKGHVSVVNFIFTSCPDMCPLLTQQMAKVQEQIVARGLPYRIVSVSVDPETDTPAVMKAYGQKYGADFKRWSFVTGPIESLQKVVIEGFKVGLEGGQTPAKHAGDLDPKELESLMQITHGEQFVVVDAEARIRACRIVHNNQDIEELLAIARVVDR